MVRFFGVVGFSNNQETSPGVWEDVITEKSYTGDVIKDTRQLEASSEHINGDINVRNSISIVANGFANERIFAIKYVKWRGVRWHVTDVDVRPPRLILSLGGIWNGNTPNVT